MNCMGVLPRRDTRCITHDYLSSLSNHGSCACGAVESTLVDLTHFDARAQAHMNGARWSIDLRALEILGNSLLQGSFARIGIL